MPELVESVPARALAVYAHPDDADVACGGTLARWSAAGAEVHVVVCAQGDKGTSDPKSEPKALAARRAKEVAAAAKTLGLAGRHLLRHPDGELDETRSLRREIVALVRKLRPEIVLCPDPTAVFFGQRYFNHRDHRVVGWVTLDAVAPAAAMPHYFPDTGSPHQVGAVYLSGTLEPDVWIDVSATVDTKAEALMQHRSQLGETAEWLRSVVLQRAEEAGLLAGVPYAESFRRLLFNE